MCTVVHSCTQLAISTSNMENATRGLTYYYKDITSLLCITEVYRILLTQKTTLLPNMLLGHRLTEIIDYKWSTINYVARVLSQHKISVFSLKNKQLQSLLSVQYNSPLNAGQSQCHTM